MTIDRSLWSTAAVALAAAAVLFGFLPGSWPNPLPQGSRLESQGLQQLRTAALAVDAACARGDLAAFAARVTSDHRSALERQFAAVDQQLDGHALRELWRGRRQRYGDWLAQPLLAGEVRGRTIAVAVPRPDGDGAQLLAFDWDGRALRLAECRHAVGTRSPEAARAAVVEAVARRSR